MVTVAFSKKMYCSAEFLDLLKAFGKAWHNGLLFKMLQANVPLRMLKLTALYLADCTFRIQIQGTHLSASPITAGVFHESILSPTLFNIYVSNMPKSPDDKSTLFLYADDTTIATISIKPVAAACKIQEALDKLEKWYLKWRIKVNSKKSAAILFKNAAPVIMIMEFSRRPWRTEQTIANAILLHRHFLSRWKVANVVMLPKPEFSEPQVIPANQSTSVCREVNRKANWQQSQSGHGRKTIMSNSNFDRSTQGSIRS